MTKGFGIVSLRKKKKLQQAPQIIEAPNVRLIFTNLSDAFTVSLVRKLSDSIQQVYCDISYPYIYFDNQYIKEKVSSLINCL